METSYLSELDIELNSTFELFEDRELSVCHAIHQNCLCLQFPYQ